ncbi:RDD family protein [Asticcacaulis sp. 201]|uniref:RDD family protein n=1 Tax=Asticcacaulis sp. 201 TaxID=3028787 RepID=UPI002916D8DD|nr:RDD family protein [Asticcacaulis sp. 201]MDV6330072.1 RDD family protein [Asticcacaulis sp. 201]
MTEKSTYVSGFWPRVGAAFIDSLLLGAMGWGIGWVALDYVSALGSNGRFIGLAIAILYYGILGSNLGGGRTLGKRILGLKVVGLNGKPLNLFVALWRALVLSGPLMLNGWYFNVTDPTLVRVLGVAVLTIVFGVTLAQIYLILFAWPERRLVHDLLSGSIVVRADTKEFTPQTRRVHTIVAVLIVLAALGLAVAGPDLLNKALPGLQKELQPLPRVMDAVKTLPEVSDVSAQDNTTTYYFNGQKTTTRTLIVTATTGAWPADTDPLLAKIGARVVKAYTFAPNQKLRVGIVHGFDLGIARYTDARAANYKTDCTSADVKCLEK